MSVALSRRKRDCRREQRCGRNSDYHDKIIVRVNNENENDNDDDDSSSDHNDDDGEEVVEKDKFKIISSPRTNPFLLQVKDSDIYKRRKNRNFKRIADKRLIENINMLDLEIQRQSKIYQDLIGVINDGKVEKSMFAGTAATAIAVDERCRRSYRESDDYDRSYASPSPFSERKNSNFQARKLRCDRNEYSIAVAKPSLQLFSIVTGIVVANVFGCSKM